MHRFNSTDGNKRPRQHLGGDGPSGGRDSEHDKHDQVDDQTGIAEDRVDRVRRKTDRHNGQRRKSDCAPKRELGNPHSTSNARSDDSDKWTKDDGHQPFTDQYPHPGVRRQPFQPH